MLLVPFALLANGQGEEADDTGPVNILGAFVDNDADRFEDSMVPFEEETGREIVYEGSGDFETLITVRAEGGSPPDVAAFPQPGLAADLVNGGYIFDVEEWLGRDYLEEKYNDAWLDLADIGGIQAGVWYRASVKSLVWYNTGLFESEGYEIPETWDAMLDLSDQMVEDGYTPWTIGIESAGATGWLATDWVEDIMLRIHPPEVYDEWVAGDLEFNSPEVKEALDYMAEIWFNEDYVLGGREGIVLTPFGDAITPVLVDPPAAAMHRQASFITGFMPDGGSEVGDTVDFFYLPPIDESLGRPVLGAGDLLSAMQDRPIVRELMGYLSTGESTRAWLEQGGFVSPHNDTPLDWYPTVTDRGIAEILQNATTFRFDASDLMPGAVGAGTFWTGMTDWVNSPNADLDAILDSIDASWPE
jgi:alpha-glucoside transport system substrate-binding protein